VFRVGSTALVVKRKTRNNGNTRHTNLSYRVCSLCSSVPRRVALRTLCMDGEARGHHTARSLQLYDYRTCITQLASSISSSQSHWSSSHTRSCPTEPSGGLASRSCEAGLSQVHSHGARDHDHLPTTANSTGGGSQSTTPLNPFRRAGFTPSLGVDDIAAACHFESCDCRVFCRWRRLGGSGARMHSVTSQPRCSQQHHHPIPHLQACS
jgi:hypothetical protein